MHTLDPDLSDDAIVLAVSENETNDDGIVVKRHHDNETKSDDENVAVNVFPHDHANENVVAIVCHHDLDNASGVAISTRHDLPRSCALSSYAYIF